MKSPPDFDEMLSALYDSVDQFAWSDWERSFIEDMSAKFPGPYPPSEKQIEKIYDLYHKLES